jgi:1,4-alpha-glucan branching enzyme
MLSGQASCAREMFAVRGVIVSIVYKVLARPAPGSPLGISLLPGGAGVAFRVWAPNAAAASMNLAPAPGQPLQAVALGPEAGTGYFSAQIADAAPGHVYLLQITNNGIGQYNPGNTLVETDPCARQVPDANPNNPSIITDPAAFAWRAASPNAADFIIYQAHVGSFAGRGDGLPTRPDPSGDIAGFDQFAAKLPYISDLAFNAVQFLPTGEYRGSDGEGYNPSNYFAPESTYGTPAQLRALVDACHAAGLAVFFDVVYNHMDSSDNLWQFDGNNDHRRWESEPTSGGGIYFSTVETGFGRRPDHDNPEVQRFFIENAAMWFDEYHADGLRFDSTPNFSFGGLQAIASAIARRYPGKLIYAEDNDPGYIFGRVGGFGACWDMGSADGFARAVGTRDIGRLEGLIERFGYPTARSAIRYFLGSHDQIFNQWRYDDGRRSWGWDKGPSGDGQLRENRYFVERIGGAVTGRSNWFALAQARMAWALNVAAPGTPLMFMGGECHHNGYWNPEQDPFGDHRFDWTIAGDPTGMPMRNLVRDANRLRARLAALRGDGGPTFPHRDRDNGVLAFRRWNDQGSVALVVVHLGDGQWSDPTYGVLVGPPGERWTEVFNSQAPQYGGWNDSGNYLADLRVADDGTLRIRLPPWSILVFERLP